MMSSQFRLHAAASLLALLLATTAAGCLAGDDTPAEGGDTGGGAAGFASFEAAKEAPGTVAEPTGTEHPVRLKLLQPADPTDVGEGEQPVVALLYDAIRGEPVTDAALRLRAEMPAMGHGTSGEVDPEHVDFGVYEGRTNFIMPGTWRLNLDARLADGTPLQFDVEVQVGGGAPAASEDGDEEPDPGEANETVGPYASYADARAAPGGVHEPVNSTSPVRLKLLEPEHPQNASTGRANVTVLLFDNATDTPVADAEVELKSFMPSMGHGTHPPEEDVDPTHTAHGVYGGRTNFIMTGSWELYFDVTLDGGDTLRFEVPVEVTEEAEDGDA